MSEPPQQVAADPAELARLRGLNEDAAKLSHAGEPKRALLVLREALESAQRLGRQDEEMRALNIAAMCHYHRGDYLAGLASGFDAYQLSVKLYDPAGSGRALMGIAGAAYALLSYSEAEQGFRRAVEIAREIDDEDLELRAMNSLGVVLGDMNRFDEAEHLLREVWTRLEPRGEGVQLVRGISNLANVRKKHGISLKAAGAAQAAQEFEAAAVLMNHALGMLRTFQSKYDLAEKTGLLGEILMLQGNYAEAEKLLRQSLEWAQGLRNHWLQSLALLSLARVHLECDREAAALEAAHAAVNEAKQAHRDEVELDAQEVLAHAQAKIGRADDAAVTWHLIEFTRERLEEERELSRREMRLIWRLVPDFSTSAAA
jgi:tetratricopeptide (TPR) repeat protein